MKTKPIIKMKKYPSLEIIESPVIGSKIKEFDNLQMIYATLLLEPTEKQTLIKF